MNDLSPREFDVILRSDLGYFAERCFYQLNPQAAFLTNWHIEVVAAKLATVRGQDPPADHQPPAAPPQILDGLDRVSGLVSGA